MTFSEDMPWEERREYIIALCKELKQMRREMMVEGYLVETSAYICNGIC